MSNTPSAHQPLSGFEIRKRFIQYFQEKRAHLHLRSASLVPSNPTVLLTPAGMLPFVPIFLGIEPPPPTHRVVTSQKCARISGKASDLEYVGRTPRHHTFFEMLGNFSFGDYFKADVIPWAWEFVTRELGLPPERLWVSVYKSDKEAWHIWRDVVGLPEEKIHFRGEKDNFWGPPGPTGPCGPCSEIFYDCEGGPVPPVTDTFDPLDTDRFVEIWNLVFMQYFKDESGAMTPLEKKNIDTGMGLERVTMVVQGKHNTFETDLFVPIIQEIGKMAGIPYGQSEETDIALKIVADHVRCVVFAIGDGIIPSNEGRGYVIRMVLRRASRYGKKYLGFQTPFIHRLVGVVRDLYHEPYTEIREQFDHIVATLQREESRFLETLERGSAQLEESIAAVKQMHQRVLPGETIFKLYDTFGFPVELTADIAKENDLELDMEGFEKAMSEQREKGRGARKEEAIVKDQLYAHLLEAIGPTEFCGYDTLTAEATVKALIVNGQSVEKVAETNQSFEAILDRTPFYPESGGQVGDRGVFSREEGPHGLTVVVNDTRKIGELIVHTCLFDNGGELRVGESLMAQVNPESRQLAAIHHSATHLLHAALKKVLGAHVSQAGSYVSPEGARFDFTFERAMTSSEIQRVEFMINKWILCNTPRDVTVMSVDEAKQSGAIAMFGEKYGERVRVIAFSGHSKELCGGTHVERLGEIGLIKITSESAIASGVRRIEMVAGEKAYKQFKLLESELSKTAAMLKSPIKEVSDRVEKLMEEIKQRDKRLSEMQSKLALESLPALESLGTPDHPYFIDFLPGQPAEGLKVLAEKLADSLRNKSYPGYVILLASDADEKANFICSVSESLNKHGIKAGDLVKQAATLCDGGGGGRPQFAQAGGKSPHKIPQALAHMKTVLSGLHIPQF